MRGGCTEGTRVGAGPALTTVAVMDGPPSDIRIATALEGLQNLDELPVVDHVARFNAVHEALTTALSSIDEV